LNVNGITTILTVESITYTPLNHLLIFATKNAYQNETKSNIVYTQRTRVTRERERERERKEKILMALNISFFDQI